MEKNRRHACPRGALRAATLALLGAWLFCAAGCAVLPFAPFALTTASFALPQNTSYAVTGVKSVYNTAYIASDERDVNTIVRDNVLTVKAQSALLTAGGSGDVQVRAYNGEIFAVGVVDTQADRDRVIVAMQNVKGVGAIKGYIRLRDTEAPVNRTADTSLENQARLAVARHLLHKNSDIAIQAVDGQLCLMGVVGTHAEALDLIQYVETVTGKPALSLLAIRDEYATGSRQTNRLYLLRPGDDLPPPSVQRDDPTPLPDSPVHIAQADATETGTYGPRGNTFRAPVRRAAAFVQAKGKAAQPHAPALAAAANKARAHVQQRLAAMAQQEANPAARAELLALASQIAQDRDLSITDRLSVAADAATQQQAKAKINELLALY